MNNNSAFSAIKSALEAGNASEALRIVAECEKTCADSADLFCLKGKAYMKQSDWHHAQTAFLHAEQISPGGPSAQYLDMLTDIMNFFNKDMYNQ